MAAIAGRAAHSVVWLTAACAVPVKRAALLLKTILRGDMVRPRKSIARNLVVARNIFGRDAWAYRLVGRSRSPWVD
jgi:hypothetical protein